MSDYDLVVIGAGAAGLAAARAARRAGRRVALIEKARPGGECTHYGCVPSKTLLDVAHRVAGARQAQAWGLDTVGDVDFGQVMRHVHQVIEEIEQDESPAQLAAEGIDLIDGWARFTTPHSVDVDGRCITGSRYVLATGAHAAIPPIPGLDGLPYLDNRTLFDLTERPEHLSPSTRPRCDDDHIVAPRARRLPIARAPAGHPHQSRDTRRHVPGRACRPGN